MNFDEKIENIQKYIDEYEQNEARMPKLNPLKTPDALTLSMGELKKKTPEELSELCLELSRYSVYLQRLINKERSWQSWSKSKIDEIAGSQLQNVPADYGWNGQMLIAKTQGEACKKLNQLLRKSEMKSNTLAYLPAEINRLSESIKDLKFMKLRQEKINE